MTWIYITCNLPYIKHYLFRIFSKLYTYFSCMCAYYIRRISLLSTSLFLYLYVQYLHVLIYFKSRFLCAVFYIFYIRTRISVCMFCRVEPKIWFLISKLADGIVVRKGKEQTKSACNNISFRELSTKDYLMLTMMSRRWESYSSAKILRKIKNSKQISRSSTVSPISS